MLRVVVSEMTYTVSSGTLNPTIPYRTIPYSFEQQLFILEKIAKNALANEFKLHAVHVVGTQISTVALG